MDFLYWLSHLRILPYCGSVDDRAYENLATLFKLYDHTCDGALAYMSFAI